MWHVTESVSDQQPGGIEPFQSSCTWVNPSGVTPILAQTLIVAFLDLLSSGTPLSSWLTKTWGNNVCCFKLLSIRVIHYVAVAKEHSLGVKGSLTNCSNGGITSFKTCCEWFLLCRDICKSIDIWCYYCFLLKSHKWFQEIKISGCTWN